jgi:hypothetical protein
MTQKRNTLNAIRQRPDREVLERLNLATIDDIWGELGKDLDGLDPLVRAGADRANLVCDLMDSAARDAREGTSWPRRHFLDLAIIAAALGLVGLLAWAVPRASSVGIALRNLRAGERVSAESLHGADPRWIANRRLTRDVPRGGYVYSKWLEPVPTLGDKALQGRYRTSLRVTAKDLEFLPTLPARASLAVSAKEPPRSLFLRGVPVLAAEKSGDAATLDAALTEAELASLLPLLPQAEIRIVRRVP